MTSLQSLIDHGGATVVIPPGTYRESDLRIPHGRVVDGKGRVTIEGSVALGGWHVDGHLRSTRYQPIPQRNGHGISFSGGQNLNDPLGQFSDQFWTRASGDTRLRRVGSKGAVGPGRFYISGSTVWVHESDAEDGILASSKRVAVAELAGTLKGVTIARFSPTPADGAAVLFKSGGRLEDVVIDSPAFVAVAASGCTNITMRKVTLSRCGWMGVSATMSDSVTIDECTFDKINDWGVFADSPQSGALKTSRCRGVTVQHSTVKGSRGHGLWFDQSTLDVEVANSTIEVSGRGLFFEISAGLSVRNCRITGREGMRVAGGSEVRVRDSVLTGTGESALGVFVDPRGHSGWSNPATTMTSQMRSVAPWIASDRQPPGRWSPRLTWQPEVIEFIGSQMRPASGKRDLTFDLSHTGVTVPEQKVFPNGRPHSGAAAPEGVDLNNLRFGSRHSDVKQLQVGLNRHGFPVAVDGHYGPQTDGAVRGCQEAHGFGHDPVGESFVGRRQAAHLGLRVA